MDQRHARRGELEEFAAGYKSFLVDRGLSSQSVRQRMSQWGTLGRWLEVEGLGAGELTDSVAQRHLAARRSAGRGTWISTRSLELPLIQAALAQLPGHRGPRRGSKKILVRTDGAGGTKAFIEYLTTARLAYSIGFTLPDNTPDPLALIPDHVWGPALDGDGDIREGAWVAKFTGLMDLTGWPKGMRVIVRNERPHPGAQLRFDEVDGMRITAFVTNTRIGHLAALELRHRRLARCEDRIRIAKDTGLRNLPLKAFAQNQIWCAIVALASDLLAWMGMLALTGHEARR